MVDSDSTDSDSTETDTKSMCVDSGMSRLALEDTLEADNTGEVLPTHSFLHEQSSLARR